MNMKMEYLINLLNLPEKILTDLNYFIDNKLYLEGAKYIQSLNLEKETKDKLIKVFISYKNYC